MTSLGGVWWCSNTTIMGSTFPKLKNSSSWKTSSVPKEVAYVRIHSHGIILYKYYAVITKQMKFNFPIIEASESIEPN